MAKKTPMTPIQRAINAREKAIDRMKDHQTSIIEAAQARCLEIKKRITRSQILLDALKRGELEP